MSFVYRVCLILCNLICGCSLLDLQKDKADSPHSIAEKEVYESLLDSLHFLSTESKNLYENELVLSSVETFIRLNTIEVYRFDDEYPIDTFPIWSKPINSRYPISFKFRNFKPKSFFNPAKAASKSQNRLSNEIFSSLVKYWPTREVYNLQDGLDLDVLFFSGMYELRQNRNIPLLLLSDFGTPSIKHEENDSIRGLFEHSFDLISYLSSEKGVHSYFQGYYENVIKTCNSLYELELRYGFTEAYIMQSVSVPLSFSPDSSAQGNLDTLKSNRHPSEIRSHDMPINSFTVTIEFREIGAVGSTLYITGFLL